MRTTVILDDDLVAKAREYTGINEKTRLIHLGLETLIQREAALRLAALGGTARSAKAGRRRRSIEKVRNERVGRFLRVDRSLAPLGHRPRRVAASLGSGDAPGRPR
jgi:Arc/MetJ family transcription regulator